MKLYSFDIFDTIIARKAGDPYGIFLEMEKAAETSRGFSEYRIEAERLMRKLSSEEEVTLEEIYQILRCMTAISEEEKQRLVELEIRTELENAVGIKETIEEIRGLREKNRRVILISDMYLPEQVIRELLARVDEELIELPLYLSSKYRKTKRTGALYEMVREQEQIAYQEWKHRGDHSISDVRVPELLGIRVEPVEASRQIQRLEKRPSSSVRKNEESVSQYVEKLLHEGDFYQATRVGIKLGGPLLFPYVKWILSVSAKQEIHRLYFMARDGYILKLIADQIIARRGLEIETFYLYGSREVWYSQEKELAKVRKQYLKEQINFAKNDFAFVDMHGTGKTYFRIAEDVDKEVQGLLRVFYYSMVAPAFNEGFERYIFTNMSIPNTGIIETTCRAPHGATIGYKEEQGKIVPVFGDRKKWDSYGLSDYFQGVQLFADWMLEKSANIEEESELWKISREALKTLAAGTDPDIVSFFGELPHDEANRERKYAPRMKKREIVEYFLWRTLEDRDAYYQGTNLTFSIARMNHSERRLYQSCDKNYDTWVGRFLHQCKRIGKPEVRKGRLILYTAGKKGQEMERLLRAYSEIQVVAWTDLNYDAESYRTLPLIAPKEAFALSYDKVLIPMRETTARFRAIRSFLSRIGISDSRILGVETFLREWIGCQDA